MILLDNINREFQVGDEVVHALRNIQLQIPAGEYLSLKGPSGSGKQLYGRFKAEKARSFSEQACCSRQTGSNQIIRQEMNSDFLSHHIRILAAQHLHAHVGFDAA